METTTTTTAVITRQELGPRRQNAMRGPNKILETRTVEVPAELCEEARPDWGKYKPIRTLRALERALKKQGELFPLPGDQVWFFGFAD